MGEARRAADTLARSCGLNETERGTLGIVVTEAATNLARHARDGYVLLRDTVANGRAGVETLAVDRGPGMYDLPRFFEDGFSTGGTAGQGLGAMRRQADQLDVYSVAGQGTVVMSRVFTAAASGASTSALLAVGAVCLPIEGETVCGDGWCVEQERDRAMVLLVDGLGHGPNAAEAADVAVAAFRGAASRTPREVVMVLHDALRSTRGAAVAVAEVRRDDDGVRVLFCGVGNTVTAIVGPAGPLSLPSMNGTAGLQVGKPQEFSQPFAAGAVMVMHTDGITTRWRLDNYPGALSHDPAVTAALIHRDHTRGRDDATVLAFSVLPAGPA